MNEEKNKLVGYGLVVRPLILLESGVVENEYSCNVAVNHEHLDSLIGRLMQMCDLIGDVEQRKALKDTIKKISRDWLDEQYSISAYDKYTGAMPGARLVSVKLTDGEIVK